MRISNDEILDFLVANGPEATIAKYENKIIELNDPGLSYFFAATVPGANIRKHEQIVRFSCNIMYIYMFAEIPGANSKELYSSISQFVYYDNPSHDGRPKLTEEAMMNIQYNNNPSHDFVEPKIK